MALVHLDDALMDRVLGALRDKQDAPGFLAVALENELARGPLAGTPYRRPSSDVRPWANATELPANRERATATIQPEGGVTVRIERGAQP